MPLVAAEGAASVVGTVAARGDDPWMHGRPCLGLSFLSVASVWTGDARSADQQSERTPRSPALRGIPVGILEINTLGSFLLIGVRTPYRCGPAQCKRPREPIRVARPEFGGSGSPQTLV